MRRFWQGPRPLWLRPGRRRPTITTSKSMAHSPATRWLVIPCRIVLNDPKAGHQRRGQEKESGLEPQKRCRTPWRLIQAPRCSNASTERRADQAAKPRRNRLRGPPKAHAGAFARPRALRPARRHHRADGRHRKDMPLKHTEATDHCRHQRRRRGQELQALAITDKDWPLIRHSPVTTHVRKLRLRGKPVAAMPTVNMPRNTPPFCAPDNASWIRPVREGKDQAGVRL